MGLPKSRGSSVVSSVSSHSSTNGSKRIKMKDLSHLGIANENYINDDGRTDSHGGVDSKDINVFISDEITAEDPWKVVDAVDNGPPWKSLSGSQKAKAIAITTAKIIFLLGLLYLFVCSLDILGSAFRLLAGATAGKVFQNSDLLKNPVAGLMIGVLVTVVLQSSSTSTSIIVAMVASEILLIDSAVFLIMGANIGTSVTSTIVAMTQVGDRDIFRRAFAGGTVHDMFNWLTVICLLPLEWATSYLRITTGAITATLGNSSEPGSGEIEILQVLTRPLTDLIVQVDPKGIEEAALHDSSNSTNFRLLKQICGQNNVTDSTTGLSELIPIKCVHIFAGAKETFLDSEIGIILLFSALIVICGSLILLVKILSGMLKGSVASVIKKTINYDFPYPLTFLTGYVAMLAGAGMTLIVQSSSVFTSILTPLVGVGVISIERMYPLTLGSNLGTTGTSVLAAFASPPATLAVALQTSLIHLFFNLSGFILWYPIPFLRKLPISAAKVLGETTATYRWFAIFYILFVFFLIPGFVFLLSWLGWQYLAGIGGPIFVTFVAIIFINVLQNKAPKSLPAGMRDWSWLPEPMRSLAPLDRVMRKVLGIIPCCRSLATNVESPVEPATVLKDLQQTTFSDDEKEKDMKNDDNAVVLSVVSFKED
ncbi:Sodium-dependent phosphate transport protein 2B [Hypsibius exemplaris]|uniref:Sodium-dependent phosphate transport protein 2B n=1 Tax=Hypsibius exemplaris TaxID=2072580 RepID=A0A1W0X841_HYPEX|nr:Sodium-dependent phosphate transport protein 2B [Hypsibius exemplaris]